MQNDPESLVRAALPEVSALMAQAYSAAGELHLDHVLSQNGLRNGREIVLDYIAHGEVGVALEHLLYMVSEPPLHISSQCFDLISSAAKVMRLAPATFNDIQHGPQ